MAVISLTRINRKKNSQKTETLVCGLVSNPIGGGNSNTVTSRMTRMALSAPIFAEEDALGFCGVLATVSMQKVYQ
jgi:hypothetical protein